jgi:GntR family transcriptional regulator/MocR family aminotransferase
VDLHLSPRGPLADDLYRQLKAAILEGRLRTGDALPATRDLAARLAVSRNTVIRAYQHLAAEGLLEGKIGAGSFVQAPAESRTRRAPRASRLGPRGVWRELSVVSAAVSAVSYDFRLGTPDPALFPWDDWRRALARQSRGPRRSGGGYDAPEGDLRLRAALARHLGVTRAVQVGPEDVIVTSGAQQAFDLAARVLVEPGDVVAVEEPGYPPVRQLLRTLGARVQPVPVDAEGLDVAALPDAARLVYVTPSHQFPLGVPMSLSRRLALLAWARRRRAAILEDDYDSELRFDGRPLDPLQRLDREGLVLYVGTFSKVLLPALRLGFLVAPAPLIPALRAAKRVTDSHGPPEPQRALAELIDEGLLARHVRKLLRVYRERRDRLLETLRRELPALELLGGSAGLHIAGFLGGAERLAARALVRGVAVEPLARYYARPARDGLAFGYGGIRASQIAEGIARLAACRA